MSHCLLSVTMSACAESLKPLRDQLNHALSKIALANADQERLVLAVHEAACNVIRHAYGECKDGDIHLCLEQRRGILRFCLRDDAPAVDSKQIKPRDLSECRPGGLGVNFIDQTMDSWSMRALPQGGNMLVMCWNLSHAHTQSQQETQ